MYRVSGCWIISIALLVHSSEGAFGDAGALDIADAEQLASRLETTLTALGPHTVLYSVNRPHCEGDDCEPGYTGYQTLIVDGESGQPGAPWFREEIYQFDEENLVIERQMWVFDGESTKGYQPNNHSGSLQRGEKFRPGNDVRKLYRERLGHEFTAALRGEIDFIEVLEFDRLDETRYQVVLEAATETSGVRYIIDFDASRGALPTRILRRNGRLSENDSGLVWVDNSVTRILDWLEVGEDLYFPKKSVLDYLSQNIPSMTMEILAFEQWDADTIAEITQTFMFPNGAMVFDSNTQQWHEVESDAHRYDIESFFSLAFGMTNEGTLDHF